MDWGLFHSIATVGAVVAFFAIAWWAYSPKNLSRFEKDAELALHDDPIHGSQHDENIDHLETDCTQGDTRS